MSSTKKLRFEIQRRDALKSEARGRMLELMHLCYENVDDDRFFADLDNKQQVILLLDRQGELQGFSTIRLTEETLEGRRVDILFSGDTVIHPDHWGAKALQAGFVTFALLHKLKHPLRPLYWLLLSKGYKTYLLLTNNFPSAFPRHGAAPPASLRALRDRVATAWWGDEYDPRSEVLRFKEARDRVKHGVAPVDAEDRVRPDIAFFLEKNPGWAQGDELVCFAEIDFGLPVRFSWKQLKRRAAGRSRRPTRVLSAPGLQPEAAPVDVRRR
jgi:hypothetical protein